jgi:hypothetical protein
MAEVQARLELKHPIETKGGETVKELVAERRLKAGDFRGIKSTEIKFDDMLTLISRLFAVPTSLVNELDAEDMMAASGVINSFLGAGPETGADQSQQ